MLDSPESLPKARKIHLRAHALNFRRGEARRRTTAERNGFRDKNGALTLERRKPCVGFEGPPKGGFGPAAKGLAAEVSIEPSLSREKGGNHTKQTPADPQGEMAAARTPPRRFGWFLRRGGGLGHRRNGA